MCGAKNIWAARATVDVHIRRLRAKIGPQFDELIQTVRNVGYKMVEENKG